MIKFNNLSQEMPYLIFQEKYEEALLRSQKNIEAISISSFNKNTKEVESRFVNIKFVEHDKFIFFTNYSSPKAIAFKSHNQIAGLFFWQSINFQIRIKANIVKCPLYFNQEYFKTRSSDKNALAISSMQSQDIKNYDEVIYNYTKTKNSLDTSLCPSYWGGYEFTPYYFEFWHGHESRLNKRNVYKKNNKIWENSIIQP